MIKKIIFLNDKKGSHLKYRRNIYDRLNSMGFNIIFLEPSSIGNIIKIIFTRNYIISSNIKCNLFVLCLFKYNCTLILNGLGRYKKIYIFRQLIGFLLKNYKGKLIIQNYHDFRYFESKHKVKNAIWLPGSGANLRETGTSEDFFTITRESKISLQMGEIHKFLSKENTTINVLGVNQIPTGLPSNLKAVGVVEQTEIFRFGNKFIWFGGYGDGFPHSLSEALFNRLEVIVSRRQYIQLGLRLIVIKKSPYKDGWVKISKVNTSMLEALYIANRTLDGIIENDN